MKDQIRLKMENIGWNLNDWDAVYDYHKTTLDEKYCELEFLSENGRPCDAELMNALAFITDMMDVINDDKISYSLDKNKISYSLDEKNTLLVYKNGEILFEMQDVSPEMVDTFIEEELECMKSFV